MVGTGVKGPWIRTLMVQRDCGQEAGGAALGGAEGEEVAIGGQMAREPEDTGPRQDW